MGKTKVYSYLRFSDPRQSAGHSAERQTDYAKRWAEEHGMALDASLSLRDEGLSAYHQRHVTQGALGTFLRAIDEGRIEPGSVLIVEGLDRLSRAEPIQAQAQLAQIINAGVTVVTASDGREYNREGLKAQPMDLVYSLLVMIRAHEESDTKSKRVTASIRRQCEQWVAGTYRGVIRNGKDPAWVRWHDGQWHILEDRAAAMRRMIDLWLLGYGFRSALDLMRKEGVDMALLPTKASSLYKTVRGGAIAGIKTIDVGGESFELADYWPALLDDECLARVKLLLDRRTRAKGKGESPSIITGIGITLCGYCGASMSGQSIINRKRKKDGTMQDGHRRINCTSGPHRCDQSGGCSVVPLERAILTWCADQMRLDSLWSSDDDSDKAARKRAAAAQKRVADIERQLARLTDAMLADDKAAPSSWVRKARELEAELDTAKAAADQAEADMRQRRHVPGRAEQWAKIRDGALAMESEQRMRARQLVAETFERIVIYHRGIPAGDPYRAPIDIVLIAKGGTPRMLKINRRSGELLTQEDVADSAPPG